MLPRCAYQIILNFVVVAATSTVPLHAQKLLLRSLTTEDGLIANTVHAIHQDARGRVWVGTDQGLSVFDGTSFTNYTTSNGLSANFIETILPDPYDPELMWITTTKGTDCFRGGKVVQYFDVRSPFFFDDSSRVLCVKDTILYTIQSGILSKVKNLGVNIYNIWCRPDGLLWLAGEQGLYSYDPRTGTVLPQIEVNRHSMARIRAGLIDREGFLWIAMWDGTLIQLFGESVVRERKIPTRGSMFLIQDRRGNLVFGSYDGLFRISKQNITTSPITRYTLKDGLTSNFLRAALMDAEGNLVLGSVDKGLMVIPSLDAWRIPMTEEETPNTVGKPVVVHDQNDHLWIANEAGVKEVWKEKIGTPAGKLHRFFDFQNHGFRLVTIDHQNWLRLIVFRGKNEFLQAYRILSQPNNHSTLAPVGSAVDLSNSHRYRKPEDRQKNGIVAIFIDKDQALWYGSGTSGAFEQRIIDGIPRTTIHTITQEGHRSNYVTTILRSRSGTMWLGTNSVGLVGLQDTGRIVVTKQVGLPDDAIRALYEDSATGSLWIGTRYGGYATMKGNRVTATVTFEEGLPSNSVLCITKGEPGYVLIGTTNGVVEADASDPLRFRVVPELSGHRVKDIGRLNDGTWWFLTINGMIFWPNDLFTDRNNHPLPVNGLNLFLNGDEINATTRTEFPYAPNVFTFTFTGTALKHKHHNTFKYRLWGADRDWSILKKGNSVNYASLQPGDYTFEVKTVSASGIESTASESLHISIVPPYYSTWWFRSMLVLAFLSIGPIVYFRRVSVLKREQAAQKEHSRRLLELQENERTRIARELHDGIGQNLVLIKTQAITGSTVDCLPESARTRFEEISAMASDVIKEARNISYDLRPYQIDSLGLTQALNSIITKASNSTSTTFNCMIETIDGMIPKHHEIHVFRMLQECISNIAKHAQATEVSIAIRRTSHGIRIEVRDNGSGFVVSTQPAAHEGKFGLGLRSLRERVNLMKGSLEIHSALRHGTTITITVPTQGESTT